MTKFLHLLPLDVQHYVIQYWLCGTATTLTQGESVLISTLSALDIACCNHASRDLFLIVAGRINFTAANCLQYPDCRAVKNLLLYMHWIHSRQIALKTLFPRYENFSDLKKLAAVHSALPFILPSVTCLQLDIDEEEDSHKWLVLLLKACPNLAHIETSVYDYEPKEYIWKTLVASHLPKLKKLVVPTHSSRMYEAMLTVLAKYGHQLEELHIVGDSFVDPMVKVLASQSCPHLRVLGYGPCYLSTAGAELLFARCRQLTELSIKLEIGKFSAALEVGKHQLRRVKIGSIRTSRPFRLDDFTHMLMRYPMLEELAINAFQYCRQSGELTLDLYGVSRSGLIFADLERVFHACTVRKLNLDDIDDFPVDTILSWLGGNLSNLESLRISPTLFETLLPYLPCPLLRQITLHQGAPSHTVFEKIAQSCPRLQNLQLTNGKYTLSQADRDVLLAGCPELKGLPAEPQH